MNIIFATASQLAQMIRNKEVSAVEVVEAYLEQIEKHNGKINAIVTLNAQGARKRAKEADEALARGENWGALHGVPITVKDTIETVEDLQLCLSLIAGADIKQPEIPPIPLEQPTNKQISKLRIAWTYGYDFLPVSQDTRTCIQTLVKNLTDTGCYLAESNPTDLDWSDILSNYGILSFFELFASTFSLKDLLGGLQFSLKAEFLARTQTSFKSDTPFSKKTNLAFPPSLAKYKAILAERDRTIAQMDRFMNDWDAWICPVSMTPAFPHRNFGQPIEVDGVKFPYLLACGGYTMPLNFTGNPVVVIPIGKSKSGLPIGVQIVGRRWQDMELLAIARLIASFISGLKYF
ncbi:MAG: amidase [Waterburya sp.]